MTLFRVPTRLGKLTLTDDATTQTSRSWIQVLTVGDYTHATYGKFSITSAMLRTMVKNFSDGNHPVDPTELCVDYDHLSEDPPHAGDGKAAGWVRGLELRANDGELWAEIEWTPPAAEAIRNKEYRYISASYSRAFTTPTGDQIGCTLQAIGLTNRPFVQGMEPVSLAVRAMTHGRRAPGTVTLAEFSFEERRDRIVEALEQRLGNANDVPYDHWWFVADVYDTYAIYRQEGRAYRIAYSIAENGVVTFGGEPEEVTIEYVPLAAKPALRAKKGDRTMATIKLKAVDGQDVDIDVASLESTELVQSLRAKVPADGAIVVDAQKYSALETSVQMLTATVQKLTTETAASQLQLAERNATDKVSTLLKAGKITSAQVQKFTALAIKDPVMFEDIAATMQVQVKLGAPLGTGNDPSADGLSAQEQAIRLGAAKRAADPKLSEGDAMNLVFAEQPALYEQYRQEVSVK